MPAIPLKFEVSTLFIGCVLVLNFSKFWADYFFSINHQIATGLQTLVPILLTVLVWRDVKKNCFLGIILLFLGYHSLRFCSELLIYYFSDRPEQSIIGMAFSYSRVLAMSAAAILLSTLKSANTTDIRLFSVFFIYSTIFSILQLPLSPFSDVLSSGGGNIVSGNGLGFFRANGGLGGTVIMYANFLVLVFIVFFFSRGSLGVPRVILWALFIASLVLCFSRSVFVSVAFILIAFYSVKKPLLLSVVVTLAACLFIINASLLLDNYGIMVGRSDEGRIDSWLYLMDEFTNVLAIILGQQLGANTGLYLDGGSKLTGDGFLFSWFFDYGFVGVILLTSVIWMSIINSVQTWLVRLCIFATVLLGLVVNSGFEKIFVMELFFIALLLLKSGHLFDYRLQKADSFVRSL